MFIPTFPTYRFQQKKRVKGPLEIGGLQEATSLLTPHEAKRRLQLPPSTVGLNGTAKFTARTGKNSPSKSPPTWVEGKPPVVDFDNPQKTVKLMPRKLFVWAIGSWFPELEGKSLRLFQDPTKGPQTKRLIFRGQD